MFQDPRFWLAISFVIFLSAMLKYVVPLVINGLDKKSQKIQDEINQAKALKLQAEQLLEEAKKHQQEAVLYSQKLVEEAKIETANLLSSAKKSMESELAKKMALAKQRITLEEDNVIREIKSNIINAAIQAIEDKATKLPNNNLVAISKKSINDIVN